MKKFFSIILLGIAIFTFAFSNSALAADTVSGAKVFSANCASCHAGGKNLVQADKNLKKDALEKYNMYSAEAIISQVTKGKNAMPAFKGRLNSSQIEDVAAYVLEQADKGW
ncbi:cytochrome c6 PetJ [Nostoc sp. 106C]|uniref:cytochrome c6 PetJ n=1 Tax=Nostoc sp. 106C TaxID=1932667 RepID=UPI000A377BBA|nr:c-type cytochrome [Nostoc sp. 106C]OUL20260.1 cytochrome C6 [Nostoc sp. 106C]OUL22381.1 cytochrome C6 [Nostoc sp. RF31YmG]